ncbi:uncharacterized protein RCC_12061 [Ramularia collo-cygni]|uniref:AA1-like domain-containing protein n=1 Tax=Ramularia collo-cygni TaxID=112498 RepID=A0A2D3UR56_9PEZI|nr:uncharacterized protein RCC_12061 [Ramularia collo-cygni]CZT14840.1 uncharacterized protein RCC_12061 [Ramularia collo-cygni]
MKLSIPILAGLAGLASAEFYVARILNNPKAICLPTGTCNSPMGTKDTYLIGAVDMKNCDAIGNRTLENGFYVDPLCPDKKGDGGKPFDLTGNVCGKPDRTKYYFRVSPADNQKLDVSFASDFKDVVASCSKDQKCGKEKFLHCAYLGTQINVIYNYRCEPVNNSGC